MGVTELINKLLVGLKDPEQRVGIASTINYLLDIYSTSKVEEDELRNDLYEICFNVLGITMGGLPKDEIVDKAKNMAEEFLRAFKLSSIHRRAMSKYKVPM